MISVCPSLDDAVKHATNYTICRHLVVNTRQHVRTTTLLISQFVEIVFAILAVCPTDFRCL